MYLQMLQHLVRTVLKKVAKSLLFWAGFVSGLVFVGLVLQTEEPLRSHNLTIVGKQLTEQPVFQRHTTGPGPSTSTSTQGPVVVQTGCHAILQGKPEEIENAKTMMHLETRMIKPDEFFINVTENCTAYKQSLQYVNTAASETEMSFPIAYIVTVHRNMQQLQQLLTSIYMPHNIYCIHVDSKSQVAFKKAVQSVARCFSNIFVASQLESVVYAGFTRLKADLNCMHDLQHQTPDWKYVINVAGQEYPLKTNQEIVQYLRSLNGQNDIPGVVPTTELHTNRFRFVHRVSKNNKMEKTADRKSPPPHNITLYFGSAYYFASRGFVQHVLSSPVAKQLLKWFEDVHSPDEYYWATLQRLPDSPGGSSAVGWGSKVRAIKWSYFADQQYPACQGQYQRNICVYGVGDLHWLTQRPHMFANKFDLNMDHVVLKCLTTWMIDKVHKQKNTTITT